MFNIVQVNPEDVNVGLQQLPDEIVLRALELLPISDVAVARYTLRYSILSIVHSVFLTRSICKRVDALACDPHLVKAVIRRDFGDGNNNGTFADMNDWNAYQSQKQSIEARATQRALRRDQLRHVREREQKKRHFHRWFTLLNENVLGVCTHSHSHSHSYSHPY